MVSDISILGRFFEIHKKLIERTISLGGDEDGASVAKLLSDPRLLDDVAKKIVGPIWDLVGKTFELDVNWKSSLPEFIEEMERSIDIWDTLFQVDGAPYFNDTIPKGKYSYTLAHFEKPVAYDEVVSRFGVAGFRELCAFFRSPFATPDMKSVFALDSKIPPHPDSNGGYVCGGGRSSENKPYLTYGSGVTGDEKFNCRQFFLVRVPIDA